MGRGGRIPPAVSREREAQAWALEIQGIARTAIAVRLGISPAAVTKILQRVERHALAQLTEQIERRKALQAARLAHIYAEAMAGWEQSKLPKKKSRERLGAAEKNGARRDETTSEAQTNPALLMAALQALADERKLFGLEPARQLRVRDETPVRRPLEALSDEQLAARIRDNDALLSADITRESISLRFQEAVNSSG